MFSLFYTPSTGKKSLPPIHIQVGNVGENQYNPYIEKQEKIGK